MSSVAPRSRQKENRVQVLSPSWEMASRGNIAYSHDWIGFREVERAGMPYGPKSAVVICTARAGPSVGGGRVCGSTGKERGGSTSNARAELSVRIEDQ